LEHAAENKMLVVVKHGEAEAAAPWRQQLHKAFYGIREQCLASCSIRTV
jgi:hypothetical protein